MNHKAASKVYICPMHPEIVSYRPGLCPKCGMNLAPTTVPVAKKHIQHQKSGNHNRHAGHSANLFKKKFWVSLVLSAPIVLYSDIVGELFGYEPPAFFGSVYLPLVLASVVFFYGGWIFIVSAYRELKVKLPGMMTLISLAISVAYFYSIAVTFLGGQETIFWELATLITIMLFGHWLEMRAVSGTQNALKELSKFLPDQAEIIKNGKKSVISLTELRKGDLILVKPGGRIPADGVIKEGISDLNESIATGESRPIGKKPGDTVIAGTTNGDGSLKITVAKIGEETFLAGVQRLVVEAQSSKSRLQMLSDRAAFYLTIIAIVTGSVTLVAWLAITDAAFAINRMVAVLVIACPHALGLAIPLVASISTAKAARNGFLVKQRLALEAARSIDIVLFDKTGTLTRGEFGVDAVVPSQAKETEVLRIAAAVNSESEHPIARAIVAEAEKRNLTVETANSFKRLAGKGTQAIIGNREFFVGNEALLSDYRVTLDKEFKKTVQKLSGQGKTVIFVFSAVKILGAIALADIIREESREAIAKLHNLGIKTAMITGDSEDVARWVAAKLDIDEYFAKVLPGEKSEKVRLLQSNGRKVAMVGDGVNDAPALTQADLGIAIGAGTTVAIESAGIILVRNDPRDIARIIRLSQLTYNKMVQNLFWATGYNVIAIPLAAGVLFSWGVLLQPALAALLMSSSTVIVAFNAVLLRNKSLL